MTLAAISSLLRRRHPEVFSADTSASAATLAPLLLSRLLVTSIDLYRLTISPIVLSHYGPACRFEPNCSSYAREAILRHGPFSGLAMAWHRLLRCRPRGGFGLDPVPPVRDACSLSKGTLG